MDAYLNTLGSTNAGLFNISGRAYPDVSTQGTKFQVVVSGKLMSLSGTSASSPTFAGIIALLNDGTILTLSVDRVLPSNTPDSWNLAEIFAYALAYGFYLTLST